LILNRRIVVTGLGAVTPLGLTVDDYWEGLIRGKSGIGLVTSFDTTLFPVKVAAEVRGFNPEKYMDLKRADRNSRCTQFAIAATKMAMTSAGLDMDVEKRERVGITMATNGMPSLLLDIGETLKTKGPRRLNPLLISQISANMVPAQVGLVVGARGPNASLNSACASGSDAIGNALNHLRLGHADVMLAGGADASVTSLGIGLTGLVGALSKNPDPLKASRPFDLNRDGFVFGEGAGVLVLETLEHAQSRGARVLAELLGAGWTFDAYNDTAPYAELQALSMKAALDEAGVRPDEVDHINAHGTSTKLNDATETKAIKMAFGPHAYKIPICSNKSMIGHLATAAGAVEAVAVVKTLVEGIIPPTVNLETPDPDCDLDYVPGVARKQAVHLCLSNSFGMGGQNCSLVFRRWS
jgi:3-oxoacyl-[acyl-carrier-protein] synthase II